MATALISEVCVALSVIIALFSEHFIQPCDANAFLGKGLNVATGSQNAPEIKKMLLTWALGGEGTTGAHGMSEEHLHFIQDQMRSTFVALPKNMHGNLGHAGVRYILHRYFLQTHAMYVKGLGPDGDTWNQTSPADIIEDRVPSYVQGLFVKQLGGSGFNEDDLGVLAATLEYMVFEDQIRRLAMAFQVHGLDHLDNDDAVASEEQVAEVIETYMQIFLLGNKTTLKEADILTQRKAIVAAYPNWGETQGFLERVRTSVLHSVPGSSKKFSFNDASRVVQEVGTEYAGFQNSACQALKKTLLGIEDQGSGRVKIQDFYSGALGGDESKWQFSESIPYLRNVGALDESDPAQLRVFISNYLQSPSNCIVSSSFFSICCLDECEGLLSQLERRIAGADATPADISRLVGALGTPPTAVVSESLQARLGEIATQHEGLVPLHGRLFAQWMHHAFPRECSYPHRAGTTHPLTADEFMEETGLDSKASKGEIMALISVDEVGELEEELDGYVLDGVQVEEGGDDGSGVLPSPWDDAEELFVYRENKPPVKPRNIVVDAVSKLVLLAALVAMSLNAKAIAQATLASVRGGKGSAKKVSQCE